MNIRSIVTTAALAAGLAASAASPTLAAGRAHSHNGVSRQYESLVESRDVVAAPVHQSRTINVWGSYFTLD